MEFKCGDKIRVLERGTEYTGKIGVIFEVRDSHRIFKYAAYFGGNRWDWQPFRPYEIEKVPTPKRQQLVFDFMT